VQGPRRKGSTTYALFVFEGPLSGGLTKSDADDNVSTTPSRIRRNQRRHRPMQNLNGDGSTT
jgi:hypothetical protein